MKTTTIRLNDELAELLEELAEADETSASALVRIAISEYVSKRAAESQEFGAQVRAIAEQKLNDRVAELETSLVPTLSPSWT